MSTPARRSSSSAGAAKPVSLHDSARGSPEPRPSLDPFDILVEKIESILGTGERIRSEEVDVTALEDAMRAYNSVETEWKRYAFADAQQKYTRNLVSAGNSLGNLLVSDEEQEEVAIANKQFRASRAQLGLTLITPFYAKAAAKRISDQQTHLCISACHQLRPQPCE